MRNRARQPLSYRELVGARSRNGMETAVEPLEVGTLYLKKKTHNLFVPNETRHVWNIQILIFRDSMFD